MSNECLGQFRIGDDVWQIIEKIYEYGQAFEVYKNGRRHTFNGGNNEFGSYKDACMVILKQYEEEI